MHFYNPVTIYMNPEHESEIDCRPASYKEPFASLLTPRKNLRTDAAMKEPPAFESYIQHEAPRSGGKPSVLSRRGAKTRLVWLNARDIESCVKNMLVDKS